MPKRSLQLSGQNEVGNFPSRSEFTWLQGIVVGLLVVLTSIVATIVLDHYSKQNESYQNLVNQVHQQNIELVKISDKSTLIMNILMSNNQNNTSNSNIDIPLD